MTVLPYISKILNGFVPKIDGSDELKVEIAKKPKDLSSEECFLNHNMFQFHPPY